MIKFYRKDSEEYAEIDEQRYAGQRALKCEYLYL